MRLILIPLLMLGLTSCAKDVTIKNNYTKMEIIHPEMPVAPPMQDVTVEAWNQARMAKEAANPANRDTVFFVFTAAQMEALLSNMSHTLTLARQQRKVIEFYKESIEIFNAEMEAKRKNE